MIQFWIFGAGASGRGALEIIGYGRVQAFIDNYKFGETYCGKKIISFTDFCTAENHESVIVIASEKYSYEIEEQVKKEGFQNYFIYRDMDIWRLKGMMPRYFLHRQAESVSYTRILNEKQISNYKNICVFGDNQVLHYLLLEIAFQNSFKSVRGIVKTTNTAEYSFGIDEVNINEVWDDIDCLILNCRKSENDIFDILEEKDHSFDIISIYDVDSYEPAFYHPELEKYKDIHKGKRIWLIGNGPSMRIEDLETLHRNGEICFGFNKIFRIYDQTDWRADYVAMTDKRVIENCENIVEMTGNVPVFVGDEFHRNTDMFISNVNYVHINYEEYFPCHPNFSDDITRQIYWGCTVSYDIGIQFARYMGAKEIYLIGMDNSSAGKLTDSRNHFIKDYFSKEEKNLYEGVVTEWHKINKAYEKAEIYSQEHGFRIYNATRGGELEVFERVDFDSLFPRAMS